MDSSGELLNEIREKITKIAQLSRNSLTLVLNAGDGLIIGEFLRQISDEAVYALVKTESEKQLLYGMHSEPSSGIKPVVVAEKSVNPASFEEDELRFDRIVGRNVLHNQNDKASFLTTLSKWISAEGFLILAENVPSLGQRFSNLISQDSLDSELHEKLILAEDEIYNNSQNPRCNWTPETLQDQLLAENWSIDCWHVKEYSTPIMIRKEHVEQWFNAQSEKQFSGYLYELSAFISQKELEVINKCFRKEIVGKVVEWRSVCLFMRLSKNFRNE